jgi:hypothetical protein
VANAEIFVSSRGLDASPCIIACFV